MSAPIKRISPELDAVIAELAEREGYKYIEASRVIAEQQHAQKEVPREAWQLMLNMFKKR